MYVSIVYSWIDLLTRLRSAQACIGMRFSIIEIKTFLFVLVTRFTFAEADEKVGKANV